jgi:hypothetical protein
LSTQQVVEVLQPEFVPTEVVARWSRWLTV